MLRYIVKRLFYIIFVFLLISVLLFAIFKAVPGDPVMRYLEGKQQEMTPAQFQELYDVTAERLGLSQPIPIQYIRWMGNLLKGDFGRSLIYRREVIEVIKSPMANTLKLNAVTMVLVFAITIPLGISTAVKKGSIYDNVVQVITILGYSLPTFVIGIVAIYFISVKLGWLPVGGAVTAGFEGTKVQMFFDRAKHMALPVFVMTFTSLGSLTRYIRAAMIDALRMDYIRTARAKGLKEKVVIYSHAFRNSLIPFVTSLVGWLIGLFGGSVAIERIFSWNGMGKLLIDSISNLDFQVALAIQMFFVLLSLAGNLIVDIAYTIVDPRVRLA